MADERYFQVQSIFDPTIAANVAMPWTPAPGQGQDPGNMRFRRLVEPRVGRFPPAVLGRGRKIVTSLVWVWTDGPVGGSWTYSVLGSASTADPPSQLRGAPAPLLTSSKLATPLELAPEDDLAIDTVGVQTTCYIRVLDLDQAELIQWKANQQCCDGGNGPSQERRTVQQGDFNANAYQIAPLSAQVTIIQITPGAAIDVVTLPELANVELPMVLKIFNRSNLGGDPFNLVPFAGNEVNGSNGPLVLPPGAGVELQAFDALTWHRTP